MTDINKSEKYLKPISELGFGQSQGHGLFWDSQIRVRVFGLEPCINDTKKYDIESFENRIDQNENVSLKTLGAKNIGFGDLIRFYEADFSKKYTLILVRYKQSGNYKCVKEVVEIEYSIDLRNYLFGTATIEELTDYVNYIKSIPPGRVDTKTKKEYKQIKKTIQDTNNMNICINPKIDSKKQRRVQCSINIDKIYKDVPWCVISKVEEPIVRGIRIDEKIHSPSRIKNKNKTE